MGGACATQNTRDGTLLIQWDDNEKLANDNWDGKTDSPRMVYKKTEMCVYADRSKQIAKVSD